MKVKRIAFAIAVLTICAASCQKGLRETASGPENGGKLKVTANITKASGTRVALTRDGNDIKSVWETGDTVLGFYNDGGWKKVAYRVTSVDGSSGTAALEYLSGCSDDEPVTADTKVYMAYAPGKTTGDIDVATSPSLPYSLAAQPGTLENLGHRALMCATGTVAADQSLSLSFTNALSLVGIDTIKGLTPTKAYTVKISGTGLKNAGTFGISSDAMAFTAAMDGEISTTSTFTASSEGKITGIYFAVPAASLVDLTVTVTRGAETLTATLTSKTVAAGKFYYKAAMDAVSARPAGALAGVFSVSDSKQVYFSQGNLVATIDATGAPTAWKFAANQYACLGEGGANKTIGSAAGEVDLFGWSTSTNGGTSTTDNYGIKTSTTNSVYSGEFYDWGKAVGDGSTWRTLSTEEWQYLFFSRTNANSKFGFATVGSVNGIIILPDTFTDPMKNNGSAAFVPKSTATGWTANIYEAGGNWDAMETAGAVFLPAAGQRNGSNVNFVGIASFCWSSSALDSNNAYYAYLKGDLVTPGSYIYRYSGYSVRLITECQ